MGVTSERVGSWSCVGAWALASVAVGIIVGAAPNRAISSTVAFLGLAAATRAWLRLPKQGRVISTAAAFLALSHIVGTTWPGIDALAIGISLTTSLLLLAAVRRPIPLRRFYQEPLLYLALIPMGLGLLSSLLATAWAVAGQRLLHVVFAVGVLLAATTFRNGRERWAGAVAVGFYVVLIGLFYAASTAPLSVNMQRFSGGQWAQTHPNVIGLLAAITLIGTAFNPAIGAKPRIYMAASSLGLLIATGSRTALMMALVALLTWIIAYKARHSSSLDAATLGLVGKMLASVLVVALIALIGLRLSDQVRGGASGPLSGREAIWEAAVLDIRADSLTERIIGTTSDATGRVTVEGVAFERVSVHNAVLASLRVAGYSGGASFALGLILLVRLGLSGRRSSLVAAVIGGVLISVLVESWLFGGTIWLLLGCCGYQQVDTSPDQMAER